jgi:GntR family transcriptional regulator
LKGAGVDIIISNSSKKPIYDQIAAQIKDMIMSGRLEAGEALPSMRVLAKELRISVITTKRAYEELERDGFIETVTGRGSFVAGRNLEFVREEQFRRIEEHLTNAVDIAKSSDIRLGELSDVLETLYEEI